MQVQHAKIKLLNRKRERGRRASKLLAPFNYKIKSSQNFKPAMSPLNPHGLSFGFRIPTEPAPLDPAADTPTSTSAPLQNVGTPKLDPAVYFWNKRVPQLVDKENPAVKGEASGWRRRRRSRPKRLAVSSRRFQARSTTSELHVWEDWARCYSTKLMSAAV